MTTWDSEGRAWVQREAHQAGSEDLLTAMNATTVEVAPRENGPGAQRILTGDGVNVIMFRFAPGQVLADHKAAHPILVQVLEGAIEFTVGGRTERVVPGGFVHLPAYIVHRVEAPHGALMQLSMLTGAQTRGRAHRHDDGPDQSHG
ncbi:cupin domain-containing protein [Devriesea agamarum]|uniref:cupin domain-containing protein n=1 Tax=Devriesea agamarum TaxID=472569 RepID=UPI00071E3B07|nr:cupin domain-containing protein [Devriesea agamarum]